MPYDDPGWTAYGRAGEELSELVELEGSVREWRVGDYSLRYTLSDESGEIAAVERTVHIRPQQLPEPKPTAPGTIYLTFDDGPCGNTAEVLDILDRYGVKASFFIVANQTRYLDLLPEILSRGHTVGIHAYSHPSSDFPIFYREENFFADFLKAQRVLYEYTGSYAFCARFPGGGDTASYLACGLDGRYEELYQILRDMGVNSFDWNLQPESATKTTEGTIRDFINGLTPEGVFVVLQHDTRSFSVAALDRMIQYGLDNGYTFARIEPDTPAVHFN